MSDTRRVERVVVTGGSGKAGRAVIRDLVDHGYSVVNADLVAPKESVAPLLTVDLTEYGQAIEALRGADAVVHLAAIPAPRIRSVEQTFRINVASTYNVFSAAVTLELERVVWASSETVLGLPFGRLHARNLLDDAAVAGHAREPDYAPIDEDHPRRPHSSYALSKVLCEEMANQFARWSGIPFIGLRISAIREPEEYARFPDNWDDAHQGEWNLWSYVDARDVAQACRLSLSADVAGADVFIIAAADTVMDRSNDELLAECFPRVEFRGSPGARESLLSTAKARTMLGYSPAHGWRDELLVAAGEERAGSSAGRTD